MNGRWRTGRSRVRALAEIGVIRHCSPKMLQTEEQVQCPHCFESIRILLDLSIEHQSYVEDCPVCCQPIDIATNIDIDGNLVGVNARRNDD